MSLHDDNGLPWFAVQTQPRRESAAEGTLWRLGVSVFLPCYRERDILHGYRREVVRPLFAGYLFASFDRREALRAVHYARGVRGVVTFGGQPAEVPETLSRPSAAAWTEVTSSSPAAVRAGATRRNRRRAVCRVHGHFPGELQRRRTRRHFARPVELRRPVLLDVAAIRAASLRSRQSSGMEYWRFARRGTRDVMARQRRSKRRRGDCLEPGVAPTSPEARCGAKGT